MALSGSQTTKISAGGSGKAYAGFVAKSPSEILETVLDFGRGFMRAMSRGIKR